MIRVQIGSVGSFAQGRYIGECPLGATTTATFCGVAHPRPRPPATVAMAEDGGVLPKSQPVQAKAPEPSKPHTSQPPAQNPLCLPAPARPQMQPGMPQQRPQGIPRQQLPIGATLQQRSAQLPPASTPLAM